MQSEINVKQRERSITKVRYTVAVVTSILAVLLIAGRRKPVDTKINEKTLSENLELYLSAQESQYEDIIPGTEKTIVWASASKKKTPYAIVYLHGFSATRQETAPLADRVAAKWGANLYYTRLTGHGRSGEAMAEAQVNDWLNDADEALKIGRRLGEKVVVIGTSTGGTLATWLAVKEAPDLAGVVLISPNYWVRASGAGIMLWPWGKQILHMVQGASYEWEAANALHEKFWTNRYPSTALVEMMMLLDHVNKMDLEKVRIPVQVIYSPNDKVVDPAAILSAYDRFGSSVKRIEVLEKVGDRNNHVLAGDILSPGNTADVEGLIDRFLESL